MNTDQIIHQSVSIRHKVLSSGHTLVPNKNVRLWLQVYLSSDPHIVRALRIEDGEGAVKRILYGDQTVATFTFDDDLGIPVFSFVEKDPFIEAQNHQDSYLKVEREHKEKRNQAALIVNQPNGLIHH